MIGPVEGFAEAVRCSGVDHPPAGEVEQIVEIGSLVEEITRVLGLEGVDRVQGHRCFRSASVPFAVARPHAQLIVVGR
jgi:hypothetical protein